jgi:hypothetical protein
MAQRDAAKTKAWRNPVAPDPVRSASRNAAVGGGLLRFRRARRLRVGAAPPAIPPWHVPACTGRRLAGNKIQARGAERVTAKQTRKRHPAATPESKARKGFVRIVRACREMPAIGPHERGKREAIDGDENARQMLSWASSHAFCFSSGRGGDLRVVSMNWAPPNGAVARKCTVVPCRRYLATHTAHGVRDGAARNRRCALFTLAIVGIDA